MSVENELLSEFNVMFAKTGNKTVWLDLVDYGYVLDFVPTAAQIAILKANSQVLNVNTLFSREEYMNSSPMELITKQILHYIEVYGLGMPGLFKLEVDNGKIVTLRLVKGMTATGIQNTVNAVIYRNAPIKNVEAIKTILSVYSDYNFPKILNNDIRVDIFDPNDKFVFSNGDDAVRWIVKNASESQILIKSKEVVEEIRANAKKIPERFLKNHEYQLANVFNRHKAILMALKFQHSNAINRIARLSKTHHQPLYQSISKVFLSRAVAELDFDFSVLSHISVRDKFKFLNLIAWKREAQDVDAFIIRNGKIHLEHNRPIYNKERLFMIETAILAHLAIDLVSLNGKTILLDDKVDYGLPISAKQTMGRLPFGTKVTITDGPISSGIYWHEDGGASDIDLSCVDRDGNRIGWGGYAAYNNKADIKFSGDVTSAYDGAMEFMTSDHSSYGLFANIFRGKTPSEADIVVGSQSNKKNWIDNVVIQEHITLQSKESIIGFVNDHTFVVYSGRLNNRMVSGANPVTRRGFSEFWTVRKLFDTLKINYDVVQNSLDYDFDLRYNAFTFDKLEKLIPTKAVP